MRLLNRFGSTIAFALLLAYPAYRTLHVHQDFPVFAIVIPKGSDNAVATQVWLHAAQEEGVPLEILHDDDLLSPFHKVAANSRGIIVPDEVARLAPGPLISALLTYVKNGGKLILVGDALTQDFNGRLTESLPLENYFKFPPIQGRVGDTIRQRSDAVRINSHWIEALQIPPGLYSPSEWENPEAPYRELCTYQMNHTPYPHWPTSPASEFTGTTILEGADGSLVAGIQKIGRGEALWINLPLSFLKERTNGMLLHSFVRWISEDWIGLPHLLGVPNGRGGLTLNVHVDSNAALPDLEIMKKMGFFAKGPFSIHVTGGPDAHEPGDGLGFDIPGNPASQQWIRDWVKQGHEVGAHGGWIHDYFGSHITDVKTPEFENYLELNRSWIEKITMKPVLEYSAPVGNQPIWVTHWLEEKGFNSYYFTGNNGLGFTQNYRDEELTDHRLWSFPTATYQQVASFEEAHDQHISRKNLEMWLNSLTKYVIDHHTIRLFYFHPPGIHFFQETLKDWLALNQKLQKQGQFRWYTMNQMAHFLTARQGQSWQLTELESGRIQMKIAANISLEGMVWAFSKSKMKNLKLISGKASIRETAGTTELQPESTGALVVEYQAVSGATP